MTVHHLPGAKGPPARSSAPGNQGYRIVNRGDTGEIYIYGTIGADWFGEGVTAKQFTEDLKKLGNVKTIHLRINSEGGSVMDARAMYTQLVQHSARVIVHIDGWAASAASFLAMAGDEIEIAEGGFFMIHNAWTVASGGADDLRRTADLLDSVNTTIRETYVARSKSDPDKVKKWMDDETYFSGPEAVAAGFADRIVENMKVAASVKHPERFRNLPAALRPNRAAAVAALKS
ncbi:head maturation protease, ClpP-related [Azospirillum himalayense]